MKIEGGCHCGAVRYVFDGEPLFAGVCHCEACRKTSGSVGSPALGVNRADFTLTGDTQVYSTKGGSGGLAHRHRCPTCGSLLFGAAESWPDLITLYAGGFDDPALYTPQMAIYTRERAEWAKLAGALMDFEAGPPR